MMQLDSQTGYEPAQWEQDSGLGNLQPSRYLSLGTSLEKALELGRIGIKHYDDLARNVKDKDHRTCSLALELLDTELEDEQNIEDILARLEIR